jgi:hypothetical protein
MGRRGVAGEKGANTMKGLRGVAGAIALILTLGVGTASAQPDNANIRTIPGANCDGQTVDLVTMNGAAAWDAATESVFVLMGAMRDGVWTLPIPRGQADRDLSTCEYTNFGHDDVIFGIWVADH